jgi:hypothetical protein
MAGISLCWPELASPPRAVMPAQRSCGTLLRGGPKITVKSFRITSVQSAGEGRAIVRFTVQAQASIDGHDIPMFPQGSGGAHWLVATENAGHWYVDLAANSHGFFGSVCP